MIVQPFSVSLGPQTFTFIDRRAIDSEERRNAVQDRIVAQLRDSQQDAMCASLGINVPELIPNFGFAVRSGGAIVGVYLMAAQEYVSGPWADLTDWDVTAPGATIHLLGRHMPAFGGLTPASERALSAEITYYLLSTGLQTIDGNVILYDRISWAIFESRTDPKSLRDIGVSDAIKTDPRMVATETPDPVIGGLTRIDMELL